jgi:hypothetical protein
MLLTDFFFVADEYELDPWHFLSVEESMPLNTKKSESLQKKVENVVSTQWKLADALQVSSSIHCKMPQFLSSRTVTSDSSILSRNVYKYSGGVKRESPHFSHLNQQQPQSQEKFSCPLGCGKVYSQNKNLQYHMKYECGKEPRFQCPYCPHRTKRKNNLMLHISSQHSDTYDRPLTL